MRDFRKLEVWQMGKQLSLSVYLMTQGFPKEEQFGITSQIRRAAISIPANIAEGAGRESDPELLRFSRIASGSLNELETLVDIARELSYLSEEAYNEFENSVRDLGIRLRNLSRKLQENLKN